MIDRVAFTFFGKDIYWYGVIIGFALLIGTLLAAFNAKKRGYKPDVVYDFLFIAVPLAIIGARAYYVIFNYSSYQGDFAKMIAIWDGGLAIYGGVIGGILGALIFRWVKGFPILQILDITAPSLILGQAIGRWGNFVNQEAYGRAILDPKWQFFPMAVKINDPIIAGQLPGYYMATFFYESAWNLIVFIILMVLTKKLKEKRGAIFALYLSLYGVGRFFIEGLRTDSLMITDTIRVSQLVSLIIIAAGFAYFAFVLIKKPNFPSYKGGYLLGNKETKKK